MIKEVTISQLAVRISKVEDSILEVKRFLGDMQRTLETMDQDRSILERIQQSVRSVEEAVILNKDHINTIFKALKLEMQVQGQRTENQIETVQDKVDEHFDGLTQNLDKKNVAVVVKKESNWQRFKKWIGGDKHGH